MTTRAEDEDTDAGDDAVLVRSLPASRNSRRPQHGRALADSAGDREIVVKRARSAFGWISVKINKEERMTIAPVPKLRVYAWDRMIDTTVKCLLQRQTAVTVSQ